jgi:hypothetical protein
VQHRSNDHRGCNICDGLTAIKSENFLGREGGQKGERRRIDGSRSNARRTCGKRGRKREHPEAD